MGALKGQLKKLYNRSGLGKEPYQDPALNLTCSNFEVNGWTISEFIIEDIVPIAGTNPFPVNELFLMVAAVCRLKPTHIFEWGTNIGKSARIFYEISRKFDIKTEIHSIDLPDDLEHQEHPKSDRGRLVRDIPEVKLYQGDGLQKSLEICGNISNTPGAFKPLFFIDGDHSYESVKRELMGVMNSIPEANVLLHDTFFQSAESGYNVGPHLAIRDSLTAIPNDYLNLSTETGLPGMTLLYHPLGTK